MTITLTKHHGLGNDFLVVDVAQADLGSFDDAQWQGLARRWCDRRRGIGADGLLLLGIAGGDELTMRLFNADGSPAEMSGNGIRCLAQAAYLAEGRRGPADYAVRTDAGVRQVQVVPTEAPGLVEASVDMGEVVDLPEPEGWHVIGADAARPVLHLGLGNPHSVVGVEDVAVVDLAGIGAMVAHVNLEIVEPGPEPHAITMRVHERGAGITEACGTGACASAWAASSWGLVPGNVDEILVHMDGGDARVRIDRSTSPVTATLVGPAQLVATILIELEPARTFTA